MPAKTKAVEFCLPLKNYFDHQTKKTGIQATLVVAESLDKQVQKILQTSVAKWQLEKKHQGVLHFLSKTGPVWILLQSKTPDKTSHHGMLEESAYAYYRDQMGPILSAVKVSGAAKLELNFLNQDPIVVRAVTVGLEIAAYNYKQQMQGKAFSDLPEIVLTKPSEVIQAAIEAGQREAQAINVARHLVNLPPNIANPQSLATFIKDNLQKYFDLEIWDEKKLRSEGMNLHLAVGKGAEHPPCLVILRHRKKTVKENPMAFVGKGITFDSGGYDMKPSSAMRLMKKDMGGAAALLGLAFWVAHSGYSKPVDFYLAFAENMVDQKAFRPSDVYKSRNGIEVEIHNTDAEGRLVLADAIDVAVTQKSNNEPKAVIDVATLTGAIKVALGGEIAGLFSNDDWLTEKLIKSSQKAGDLCWRMPLYNRYTSNFSSAFADIVNAVDGFAGAITAALFLEKFVANKSWAHLDIYAWNDKPTGALQFSGGSGQSVQALIEFLKNEEK